MTKAKIAQTARASLREAGLPWKGLRVREDGRFYSVWVPSGGEAACRRLGKLFATSKGHWTPSGEACVIVMKE